MQTDSHLLLVLILHYNYTSNGLNKWKYWLSRQRNNTVLASPCHSMVLEVLILAK